MAPVLCGAGEKVNGFSHQDSDLHGKHTPKAKLTQFYQLARNVLPKTPQTEPFTDQQVLDGQILTGLKLDFDTQIVLLQERQHDKQR